MEIINKDIEQLNAVDVDLDTEQVLYSNPSDNTTLKAFLEAISNLKNATTEQDIEDKKSLLMDIDYLNYMNYLEENYKDLYNILFGCQ